MLWNVQLLLQWQLKINLITLLIPPGSNNVAEGLALSSSCCQTLHQKRLRLVVCLCVEFVYLLLCQLILPLFIQVLIWQLAQGGKFLLLMCKESSKDTHTRTHTSFTVKSRPSSISARVTLWDRDRTCWAGRTRNVQYGPGSCSDRWSSC